MSDDPWCPLCGQPSTAPTAVLGIPKAVPAKTSLDAVRDLHKRVPSWSPSVLPDYCEACISQEDDRGDQASWPCSTARLVYTAAELDEKET